MHTMVNEYEIKQEKTTKNQVTTKQVSLTGHLTTWE